MFSTYIETHLETRDTYRLKVKGWKKIFYTNRDQKKAGVAILITDKINFEIKAMKREKEGHYITIQGSIQEEDITTQPLCHRSSSLGETEDDLC